MLNKAWPTNEANALGSKMIDGQAKIIPIFHVDNLRLLFIFLCLFLKSVTYVSGIFCYPCLGKDRIQSSGLRAD